MINNLLLDINSFLTEIACTSTNCLCWIIVALNILTVFYLVFCSFFKVNTVAKVIGWIWLLLLVGGTVVVIVFHTCIYALLCAIFTTLIMVAVLSAIITGREKKTAEKAEESDKKGCYVISKEGENYYFALYDEQKNFIVRSVLGYSSIADTKQAIIECRESGKIADVEDYTQEWVKYVDHPKYEIFAENGKYFFRFSITQENVVLISYPYKKSVACIKDLEKLREVILSEEIYFNLGKDVKPGDLDKKEEAVEEVSEEPVVEETPALVIKTTYVEEPVEEVAEVVEEPIVEDEKTVTRYNYSFKAKLILVKPEMQNRYKEIVN